MSYTIKFSESAALNLKRIVSLIEENFGYETSKEVLYSIKNDILKLKDNPFLGMKSKYKNISEMNYRFLHLKKVIVVYRIDDKEKIIFISNIYDYRQDYINILKGL